MAPIDRQVSATGVMQQKQRICHPAWESVSLRFSFLFFFFQVLFLLASCVWQPLAAPVSVCVTPFFSPADSFMPKRFRKKDLRKNYCRNPDNSTVGPWCFTIDPQPHLRHQECGVPQCSQGNCTPQKTYPVTISTCVYGQWMPVLRCKLLQEKWFDRLKMSCSRWGNRTVSWKQCRTSFPTSVWGQVQLFPGVWLSSCCPLSFHQLQVF